MASPTAKYSLFFLVLGLIGMTQGAFRHELPVLPYLDTALEPFIRTTTMVNHHRTHHRGYVDKLNVAMQDLEAEGGDKSLEQKIAAEDIHENLWNVSKISNADLRKRLQNFGGGHVNHSFFWKVLISPSLFQNMNLFPELYDRITSTFKSEKNFEAEFTAECLKLFGSGWTWLVSNTDSDRLEIVSTHNQNHPQMSNKRQVPIFGIDLWEHAYYLQHYAKRDAYVKTIWNIANWEQVAENLNQARGYTTHEDL